MFGGGSSLLESKPTQMWWWLWLETKLTWSSATVRLTAMKPESTPKTKGSSSSRLAPNKIETWRKLLERQSKKSTKELKKDSRPEKMETHPNFWVETNAWIKSVNADRCWLINLQVLLTGRDLFNLNKINSYHGGHPRHFSICEPASGPIAIKIAKIQPTRQYGEGYFIQKNTSSSGADPIDRQANTGLQSIQINGQEFSHQWNRDGN